LNRREFLIRATAAAVALGTLRSTSEAKTVSQPKSDNKLKKGIIFNMLPGSLSVEDRFKLAKDVGFDGVEATPTTDPAEIKNVRDAADKAGIAIHSIIFGGWQAPLSTPDENAAKQGIKALEEQLKTAKDYGADGVLLVPGVVNADTRYIDCYQRSQKYIKQAIPTAEKLGVRILIENVWNNFLLSPIEAARYIDEFKSPWVQAYFDVGNVIAFGWSEDWIRTLGHRIKKIHVKDFKKGPREWVNLMDGDVNWPEVRKALNEVGYSGYLTAELNGGDEKYLRDVSQRMDKIINLSKT
jgi:L-ribulose-5-phosphate 3-epimerase